MNDTAAHFGNGSVQAITGLVDTQLADPGTGWAIGAFGAVGEFMRDADEPVAFGAHSAVTARGAIRLAPPAATRAIAYETVLGEDAWSGAIALCVPASTSSVPRRATLTELGPDRAAIRPGDRGAILFDLGLALANAQACVRTGDATTIATLRRHCGRALLADGAGLMMELPALSPHRVFISDCGRIEVYQPIPAMHGRTPEGPHTHVLPKLLRAQRTHAADVPVPEGWLPAATIHPANPLRDGLGRPRPLDRARLAEWEALFARFAPAAAFEAKRRASARIARDGTIAEPVGGAAGTRTGRLAARVALRQARALGHYANGTDIRSK